MKTNRYNLLALAIGIVALASAAVATDGRFESPNQSPTPNDAINNTATTLAAGDPISTATGAYFFEKMLLRLGGPLPLSFRMNYGSDAFPHESGVGLPDKFAHNHRGLVSSGAGPNADANIFLGLGQELLFKRVGGGDWLLASADRVLFRLIETTGFFYLTDPEAELVHVFKKTPVANNNIRSHLVAFIDRNGNTLTYTPAADPLADGPASVSDGLGRSLTFTYGTVGADPRKFLTKVEDHTGRAWTFQYEDAPADNAGAGPTLRSVTDPLAGAMTFTYGGDHRITAKQMPEGNTPYTQVYGAGAEANSVATQTDALGRTTTIKNEFKGVPGFGETQFSITNPDGSVARYFHTFNKTLMSAMTDETGRTMRFEQSENLQQIGRTIDSDGTSSEIAYDPASGRIAAFANARGEKTTLAYQPVNQTITNPDGGEMVSAQFFDLVSITYADATQTVFVRDAKGNPTRITDRAGDVRDFTYNGRGQPLTLTNEEGGVTTFTYDAAANLQTVADTDTGATTLAYDALNRLVQITLPDASTAAMTYDALDRTTTRTDPRGTVAKFDYDANSNLTRVTRDFGGALAQQMNFEYDLLDRRTKIIDPAGNESAFEYPYFEQLSKLTFPDGTKIEFEYDARRTLSAVTDELGLRTAFERNDTAEIVKATSPEGRVARLERDAIGVVVARIDHTGDRTSAKLDVNSRVAATTDPLGRKRSLIRDGEGRVTSRTEPIAGDTLYEYDDNGRLTKLTDARGKIWAFTYTGMGRLDTVTDPNAKVWDRDYDTRGRLSQITYPDGVVETRTYDAESHLTARAFSDGLNLGYTYDALDRISATASTPVALAYDTRNNLTATSIHGQTFTATHDTRNRVATLDYAGQMTVTYTRDARGLVTRVTDSLSGAQVDIAYNKDRQMTKVTRSNGVVTDYSYDAEGKIAQIKHAALGTIDFTFNAANEPTAIADTAFPVDGAAALTTASTETQTFDDANQLTSGGYAYDLRGRPTTDGTRAFTWDSANRLTQVVNGADTVAYDYTATGELASRTLNGQTTQFGYSYSIADRPILAERKAGAFTRFYVASPNGRLLYAVELSPTPSVRFHHFGKVGETRFLTDAAGAVTDAYAYDAYGRLLARTGTSDQIYAFVGELGVRNDPAAGLIHMRARHYDPKSGRFLSRDPIFLALAGRNSQHANPYHYVQGMPTWVVDPSGLDSFLNDLWAFEGDVWAELEDNNPPDQGMGAGALPEFDFATNTFLEPQAKLDAGSGKAEEQVAQSFVPRVAATQTQEFNGNRALFKYLARLAKELEDATPPAPAAVSPEDVKAQRVAELERDLAEYEDELFSLGYAERFAGEEERIQGRIDEIRRELGFDVDAENERARRRSEAAAEENRQFEEAENRRKNSWFRFFFPGSM